MGRSLLAAAVIAAAIPFSAPAWAGQDDPRLGELFSTLQTTSSEADAAAAERTIWLIWIESRDAAVAQLMRHGIAAMSEDDIDEALVAFTAVVQRDEHFAEGWNKKATVEFVMGNYEASVADIERTLALEPRHFGALSGLGKIYLELDQKKDALRAFRAALAINPHLHGVREMVERLKKELEGDPI